MFRLPLLGLRVIELAEGVAGVYTGRLLGDMGAEVIKIEPPEGDPLRRGAPLRFQQDNRNKYGCVLDISKPEGRQLLLRLLTESDIVILNASAEDVSTGLSYDSLRQIDCRLIVVSISQSSATSGASAGAAAVGAIGLALWQRRRTGEGQHIEIDQEENLAALQGDQALASQRSAKAGSPGENAQAPPRLYPCSGQDQWVAISCRTGDEFRSLWAAIDRPGLAADARFKDAVARSRNRGEIDTMVAEWTGKQSKDKAAMALQEAGVAAIPVLAATELLTDSHLRARGFFEEVVSALGTWQMQGPHWRLRESSAHIRLPAPALGEHNYYVFRELLGLSEWEVEALRVQGVTH